VASAVAYAFLSSALDANRTAALILTPKKLMNLRPENLLALQRAHIPLSYLLHPENLPNGTVTLVADGVQLALVDHNVMLPAFGDNPDAVVAIVDHHEDEGAHKSAVTRFIRTPTGSTASLVTSHFMPQWKASVSGPAGATGSPVPPELATLLLSAILIDTQGLKKGGKAVDVDYQAAQFLYPLSTLANATTSLATTDAHNDTISNLQAFSTELAETKFDVTGMSTADLLQRDYKQYSWTTTSTTYPELNVGLSTVPMSLTNQLTAEASAWESYMAHVDSFMAERHIDIEGVLTSFKSEKKKKSKREILLVVRTGGAIKDIAAAKHILTSLTTGLSADVDTFALAPWGQGKGGPKGDFAAESVKWLDNAVRVAAVFEQGNHHSTRKQVQPAMVSETETDGRRRGSERLRLRASCLASY
jgi:exopolyphosphatase